MISKSMASRLVLTFSLWLMARPALAAEPILPCRFDDALIPSVRQALEWGIQGLNSSGRQLPFDQIAINPRAATSARTLRVEIIKDATLSTVDQAGCIKAVQVPVGSMSFGTDGPCVPTDLDKCNSQERQYMLRRMQEIHGYQFGDSQTGYEWSGACYMTNLHACLQEHRFALLDAIGPRDLRSVRGVCIANAIEPVSIRCSAGALKMLLSREAARKNAPTIAMVFVLSHELAHLAAKTNSTYDAADYVVDRSWPREDKITRIQDQCRTGESLRQRERDADTLGIQVVKERLPEIARKWPEQGTNAWLITQAVHQSTNLARWGNDWRDGPTVETPQVFLHDSIQELQASAIPEVSGATVPSGRTPQEVELSARRFLCELGETRAGRWDVLIQSGSTHGTLIERVATLAEALRPLQVDAKGSTGGTDALVGGIDDLLMGRQKTYLRELEGAICTLVSQPLACSNLPNYEIATQKPDRAKDVRALAAPTESRQAFSVEFAPKGPYREVSGGDPKVLTISIGSHYGAASKERTLEEAMKIRSAYTDLLSQVDGFLHAHGGYWVSEWHSEIEVEYSRFTRDYLASVNLRAVVRVPAEFTLEALPALKVIGNWGRIDNVYVHPWRTQKHTVVIHFFRPGTEGANKDSQRVLTQPLRFDQIFDLAAARDGVLDQPAAFFRDLLPFLHSRLKAKFGGAYTLGGNGPEDPFYITSGGLGDNFYLPKSWEPLIDSVNVRATPDEEFANAILRVYIDNATEENVAEIFGP